ncbi:hypothetical protein [Pseudanabaena sp. BC1403]|uniref:hypothetical protein n=1 Tax=Pseudanabaena sp. BC1403 TaxID=2043171 RepID=UPI000CD81D03|nr:hypothetical protein [Pseudanabaena sp. BC1403]
MPPLIIEATLALAIIASAVKVTVSISSIQQSQKVAQAEVLGEIKVIHKDIQSLKDDTKDLKAEVKENRKHRYSDRID